MSINSLMSMLPYVYVVQGYNKSKSKNVGKQISI